MENKFVFVSFSEWYMYLWRACKRAAKGLCQIVFCLVMGIVSVLFYCFKQIEAFCRREPIAAGIVGVLFVFLSVGWCLTFVNGRAATRAAEYQRDSIGYKLDMFMHACDTTKMYVVARDTIRYEQGFLP